MPRPSRPWFRALPVGLNFKIGMLNLVLFAAGIGAASYFAYAQIRDSSREAMVEQARAACDRLSSSLGQPFWNLDYDQARSIILGEMNNRNVSLVNVKDSRTGRMFVNVGRDRDWAPTQDNTPDEPLFIAKVMPIVVKSHEVGLVEVRLTSRFLNQTIREKMSEAGGAIAVSGFLFLFINYLFAKAIIIDRVKRLTGLVIKVFDTGDYSLRSGLTGRDELGVLAADVNRMLEHIQRRDDMLRSHAKNLAQAVDERTAELSRTNAQLILASQAKSEFLANTSHEIRTPLNAILGMSDLAMEAGLEGKARDYVAVIRKSGKTLLNLINDILDLSKIEAGKIDIESVDFDLSETMDDLADMFRGKSAEKDLEFVIDLGRDVPRWLVGDPLRLRQILGNLLSNAFKFTDKGEVRVVVRADGTRDGKHLLEFTVADTGVGIPEDKQDQIFSPFTQADGSTTRIYGGTGLGLSICQNLARMMGSEGITVESRPGEGSRFSFSLPLQEAPVPESRRRDSERLPRVKVMVVDDNDGAREMLGGYLESWGLEQSGFASAEEALEAYHADRDSWGLVLLDYKLWGLDGLEAARIMRMGQAGQVGRQGQAAQTGPPIILVTAFGKEVSVQRDLDARVDAVLHKPVKQSELFDAIMDVCCGQPGKGPVCEAPGPAPVRDFTGKRVLVVEDNEINRQIVIEILAPTNIEVATAADGREGVEKALSGRFDLILMDVQMPVMDGYEATRAISGKLGERRPPIVALSAHAMKGDSDLGLASGMDDYLTKPISKLKLIETLHRWMNEKGRQPESELDAAMAPDQGEDAVLPIRHPVRLPGLETRETVERLGVSWEGYGRMVSNFAGGLRDAIHRLRGAVMVAANEEVKALAHSVAGPASSLGFTALARAAKNLERLAASPDNDLSRPLQDVDTAVSQALESAASLEGHLRQAEAPAGRGDPEGARKAAVRLVKALEESDPVGSGESLDELARCMPASPLPVRLGDLLRNYRFEEAGRVAAAAFGLTGREEA